MATKEGIIERQKLDCNCNDCKHLFRSFSMGQTHIDFHYKLQKDYFDSKRQKLLKKADEWRMKILKGDCSEQEGTEKYKSLIKESTKMVFVFNSGECTLQAGLCIKNGLKDNQVKPVTFIPETFQIETQYCFEHRKG